MHVHFDPETVDWRVYLVQSGGGAGFYVGRPYQRGAGIGAVLGGIFRFLLPVLKGVGRELGREGLAVGSRVLGDVAQGKAQRDSLIDGTVDGLRNVIDRTKPSEGLRRLVDDAAARQQRGRGGVKGQSKKRPARIQHAKQLAGSAFGVGADEMDDATHAAPPCEDYKMELEEAHKMVGRLQLTVERLTAHVEGLTNAAIDERRHHRGVVWERDACKQEVDSLKVELGGLVRKNALTLEVSQRRINELTELNRVLNIPRHEATTTSVTLTPTNVTAEAKASPYKMKWGENGESCILRPYMEMMDATMSAGDNTPNGITLEQYASGWTFFVLTLTPTPEDHRGFELVRNGTTTLHMRFSKEIETPGVMLLCLAEFDQLLSIDQHRVVLGDGAV